VRPRTLCPAAAASKGKTENNGGILEAPTVQHDDPKDDPLYAELVSIGRREKTIRPEALTRHDNLLNCTEVLRRSGPDAQKADHALRAHEAITEAIAKIVSPTTRMVAEAALCTTKDYEGLKIKDRIHNLPPDITENVFKYHRELAFREIVEFLKRSAPHKGSVDNEPAKAENDDYISHTAEYWAAVHLTTLAEQAARLHFAGLASMFAFDFEYELWENKISPWRWANTLRRMPIGEYVFETYISLAYRARPAYDFEQAPELLQQTAKELVLALHQELCESSPAGPDSVSDEDARWLPHEIGGLMHLLPSAGYTARKVYLEKWYEWYGIGEEQSRSRFMDAARPITAISGAIAHVLARNVSLTEPIYEKARLMAHKALGSFYEFDEWAPIVKGESFRYRTNTHFDSESPVLTNQALMLHDSSYAV